MNKKNTIKKYTFLDLFSGCGGFSYGLEQAGLKCLAGVDHNEHAINTFRENHSKDAIALVKDMMQFSPTELAELIGTDHVDVIIGGPLAKDFPLRVNQLDRTLVTDL